MKKIVIFGAGLSATYLINYLEDNAQAGGWELTIIDRDIELAMSKCHLPTTVCIELDIKDNAKVAAEIAGSSLVVSMLPATLHITIAKIGLALGIHLATAS